MKQIQLQGIGKRTATEAKNIKVGDVLIWNFGATSQVIGIEFSKTGKTLTIQTISGSDGKQYERRLGAERLVAIQQ